MKFSKKKFLILHPREKVGREEEGGNNSGAHGVELHAIQIN